MPLVRALTLTSLILSWAALAAPISVSVDLTDAPKRLYRAEMTFPVQDGPLTLVYPKWLPGEHGPTGPLVDVSNLYFRVGGKALPWKRNPIDLHAFTVEIPKGASELKVELTLLSPAPDVSAFSSGTSATANIAVLSWNQVLLLPQGVPSAQVQLKPSVRLPSGWKWASALTSMGPPGATVNFQTVSAETLVDSPLLSGAHLNVTALGSFLGAPVSLAVAAETAAEAQIGLEDTAFLKKLIAEEVALYGARHFDRYVFLLTASDALPSFGLEHHQSSDNRLAGQVLVDKDIAKADLVPLLAHESTHSWNGKYRRPAGLATADFTAPMHSELLWIYEGLTQYLGHVLTARSGAWNAATAREHFAATAQKQRLRKGRAWRPLEDTAVSAQLLYGARDDWQTMRRGVDFYDEGDLLWLEVDVIIRQQTAGKKSIDDFVRAFHGGTSGSAEVKPYTLDELVAALNAVAPFDWKNHFAARVQAFTSDAPLVGLEKAGWRLAATDTQPELAKIEEKMNKTIDLRSSIGLMLNAETFAIKDVMAGSAADKAGLAPGMHLVAVNTRKVTVERLLADVALTKKGNPLALLAENTETFRTFTLDYKGGLSWPTLEPIAGKTDLLEAIFRPRAP